MTDPDYACGSREVRSDLPGKVRETRDELVIVRRPARTGETLARRDWTIGKIFDGRYWDSPPCLKLGDRRNEEVPDL